MQKFALLNGVFKSTIYLNEEAVGSYWDDEGAKRRIERDETSSHPWGNIQRRVFAALILRADCGGVVGNGKDSTAPLRCRLAHTLWRFGSIGLGGCRKRHPADVRSRVLRRLSFDAAHGRGVSGGCAWRRQPRLHSSSLCGLPSTPRKQLRVPGRQDPTWRP